MTVFSFLLRCFFLLYFEDNLKINTQLVIHEGSLRVYFLITLKK